MATKQNETGKAFEFACLKEIAGKATSLGIHVTIIEDATYHQGKSNYSQLPPESQSNYTQGARAALQFIFDCEPYLYDKVLATDLELSMQPDGRGQQGDVRDLLFLRWESSKQKKRWECGISCKHNHAAVKHQRVGFSPDSDFIRNWCPSFTCSKGWRDVADHFFKITSQKKPWNDLFTSRLDELYRPVIDAVYAELMEHKENAVFVEELFSFLLGTIDFYKVMAFERERLTQVSVFNFNGTLNRKTAKLKAIRQLKKTPVPKRILAIAKVDSILTIHFDFGWSVRMRIHTAESISTPSLKFDSQLQGIPVELLNLTFPW